MIIRFCSLLLTLILLTGCVYRVDIQQGNEITAEMISKLKIGMTQYEVTRVLGYPLINDPFHKDRWDYFYYRKSGETAEVNRQSATLFFADSRLSEIKTTLTTQD